jgi:hypothetical protein
MAIRRKDTKNANKTFLGFTSALLKKVARTYLKIPVDVRVVPDVIPAKAGIQHLQAIFWMPASAGMTNKLSRTEFEIGFSFLCM